ncbi:MAG TPA: serine/threonine-protein kinase [Gemmatales bacterium]|nr:serine/threonine-protein kinase [Gemmatales bacterium]
MSRAGKPQESISSQDTLQKKVDLTQNTKSTPLPSIENLVFEKLIGRGTVGVVYRALDTKLGRQVAIKVLTDAFLKDEKIRHHFTQEAEIVAKLNHPSVIQVYASGVQDNIPYIVLEYCSGGNLSDYLKGSKLPPLVTANFILPLALALEHAHNRGIIHRDFKPSNILLIPRRSTSNYAALSTMVDHPLITSFSAKITDLGFAHDITSSSLDVHEIIGTASYMAPEQADPKAEKDGVLIDVYSLGATMYECLTGRPPHLGKTPYETLTQLRNQEPIPIRAITAKVPVDLEAICMKCLARNPAERYQSVKEVIDDLNRFIRNDAVSARPRTFWEQLKDRLKEKYSLVLISITAILTCGLTALLYYLLSKWLR